MITGKQVRMIRPVLFSLIILNKPVMRSIPIITTKEIRVENIFNTDPIAKTRNRTKPLNESSGRNLFPCDQKTSMYSLVGWLKIK
jgi:hypothetical protein